MRVVEIVYGHHLASSENYYYSPLSYSLPSLSLSLSLSLTLSVSLVLTLLRPFPDFSNQSFYLYLFFWFIDFYHLEPPLLYTARLTSLGDYLPSIPTSLDCPSWPSRSHSHSSSLPLESNTRLHRDPTAPLSHSSTNLDTPTHLLRGDY